MIRLIYYLVIIALLTFAVLVSGCATKPTPEQEHNEFSRLCDERVQKMDQVYEFADRMFKPGNHDDFHEWRYAIGLYHGCVHGIMDWVWWRDAPFDYKKHYKELEERRKREGK